MSWAITHTVKADASNLDLNPHINVHMGGFATNITSYDPAVCTPLWKLWVLLFPPSSCWAAES